jgi:hypothetical protein
MLVIKLVQIYNGLAWRRRRDTREKPQKRGLSAYHLATSTMAAHGFRYTEQGQGGKLGGQQISVRFCDVDIRIKIKPERFNCFFPDVCSFRSSKF